MLPSTGSIPFAVAVANPGEDFCSPLSKRRKHSPGWFAAAGDGNIISVLQLATSKSVLLAIYDKKDRFSELRGSQHGREQMYVSPPSSFANNEEERTDKPSPSLFRKYKEGCRLRPKRGSVSFFPCCSPMMKTTGKM